MQRNHRVSLICHCWLRKNYPCTWPEGFPRFRLTHVMKIGRESAYNIDTLNIDGNTGTQMDVPPHSVARPELKLPNSGPYGNEFTEKSTGLEIRR